MSGGPASTKAQPLLLPLLVALVPFAWLVLRFDWLCDDAFISFRYAKHLAQGLGLRFNPLEEPPVEGYTNFLWVLLLTPFEALGLGAPAGSRILSIASGVALIAAFVRSLARQGLDRGTMCAAGLFLGTFTPLAVWSTGGLETAAFTLCAFLAADALFWPSGSGVPRARRAAPALIALVLLRADGAVFGLILLAAAALRLAWPAGSAAAGKTRGAAPGSLLVCAIFLLATLALHVAWRFHYHGDYLPNTARAKVDLGAQTLVLGAQYVASFLVVFPSVPLVLLAAVLLRRRMSLDARAAALSPVLAVLGFFGYAVAVGGDFMAMGRFLVPAAPLVAALFSRVAAAVAPMGRAALTLACCTLSLLPAFDLHAAPLALREKLHFRWGNKLYLTEHESWRRMKSHAQDWSAIGRALALHTRPGESLTAQGIGCFGYFTELSIIDLLGLVNRELLSMRVLMSEDSAGHRVRPSAEYMRYLTETLKPTYGGAEILPSRDALRPLSGQAREEFEELLFDLHPSQGFEPGSVLRILKVRY